MKICFRRSGAMMVIRKPPVRPIPKAKPRVLRHG